jgi:hypothetical protein
MIGAKARLCHDRIGQRAFSGKGLPLQLRGNIPIMREAKTG